MAKQIKYRKYGSGDAWRSLSRIGGVDVIPGWLVSSMGNEHFEVELRDEFSVGDQFQSSAYMVEIVGEAQDNIKANGEKYSVYPCRYKDGSDGETFYDYVPETSLRGYNRLT